MPSELRPAPRRLSSHKTSMVLGIAESILSIAQMRDGTLQDSNMRLSVIQADAARIISMINAAASLQKDTPHNAE